MICAFQLDRNRAQARVRSKLQSYNRIKTMKESLDWSAVSGALDKWMIYVRQLEFETAVRFTSSHCFCVYYCCQVFLACERLILRMPNSGHLVCPIFVSDCKELYFKIVSELGINSLILAGLFAVAFVS